MVIIKYIKIWMIILFILIQIITLYVKAYSKDLLYNPNDVNEQLNNQRKDFLDYQNFQQFKNRIPKQPTQKNTQTLSKNPSSVCFYIDKISLQSSMLSLQDKIQKEFKFLTPILKSYTHQCLSAEKITELLNELKLKSLKKGYITTVFGVSDQDLNNKKLIITLQTSILKEIEYKDKKNTTRFWGKDYSIRPGDIFTIRPIDRGLYNLKRLKTLNPIIEISSINADKNTPIKESKITINNQSKNLPIYASLNANNAGSTSTGIYQTSLQFGVENLLLLAEILRVYGLLTPDWKNSHNLYVSADFSIPFRRFLFSISGSYSQYAQNLSVNKNTFSYNGYSANMDVNGNFLIYLDNLNQISFNLGLGKRWAKNYIEDIELIPQRRNLTNIYANINYIRFISRASINLSLGVKQGIKFLGSMDNFTNSKQYPDFFYTIPTIDAYIYAPFKILNQNLAYTSLVKTQVSRGRLYASEKFGLGGIYSVRGFDSLVLNGEMGILNRNDITYYLPPFFKISLAPAIGLDMGYTTDIYKNTDYVSRNNGSLIGGGVGLKFYWGKYFNAEIWGYHPIYNPNTLKGRYFYANLGFNWE
ncbi:ShlB/FhaC/HecB family hemolysin secretion/activation protein [Helicobacter cappadocius]|uniref:ShlB/FhaC/HecB family hemolysin secretion/activation protein n=1 Tax=Helicobacter cappadocius TaxID=3063998 RepID=A0AA90T4P1_9HELI|nr:MULTISPECIES: ShlB/FhaC/HecB family hemolysin secretion/activation protein [unclassified Helicobacter]MDO7252686.1 ShlB/FhaC/HecB family hemolysin secretion/activation protein [Helicobacter sp. faydin-H75]MDP2538553.1 ShlB/FhaC/HecB family hemolysin secretion/activation protein [Helicobacter sp. faydin-H76]